VSTSITPDSLTEPPVYETQADVTVPSNAGIASVAVTQGITHSMQQLGVSDGTPGQSFSIPSLDVETDGTLSVYVQGPDLEQTVRWNQVDSLIDSPASGKSYIVSTDDTGVTWITFGDNVNGEIPGTGLTIYVTYRVIVGAAGNLPAGTVSTIYSPVQGVNIALQLDGVTPQSTAMTGGSDPESNDSIRQNAALAFTAQDRAVSLDDFTNLAYAVPGVLMANATGVHSTSVALYIAGPNYAAPSASLIDAVLSFFATRTALGVSLSVLPPAIILIDVGTSGNPVQLVVKDSYSQSVVSHNVTTTLQALLNPPNVRFGQLISVSDIYQAILGVDGVLYCVIPVFTREDTPQVNDTAIQLRPNELPNAGTVFLTVSGGY
jgi:predicted phage baseplate assembly protein